MDKYKIINAKCSKCGKTVCGTYETITGGGWIIKGPLQICRECADREKRR